MPGAQASESKVPSRRIAVDADVGRSAGWRWSDSPLAAACRACLDGILEVCHRAAMSERLWDEWQRNMSGYASLWFTAMLTKNKIHVIRAEARPVTDQIWRSVEESPRALRDAHLLVAAISADQIVISRDDTARRDLAERCRDIAGVCEVTWACPEHDAGVIEWLEQGAPSKPEWTLGQGQTT